MHQGRTCPATAGRRRFLCSIWYLALGTGPEAASAAAEPASGLPEGALTAVRSLFRDLPAVQALGRLYLRSHPDENCLPDLLQLALGPAFGEVAHGPALRRNIARRRARDFLAGDIALLDGWVFSRSEARIFALTALR